MAPHSVNGSEGIPLTDPAFISSYESVQDALEPLAVVGFSLRFPQDADTTEGFWRVLEERRDVMTPWPEDRMNFEAFCTRNKEQQTTGYVPGAHFLRDELGKFDAQFFGISANEALAMDVQHRILLEEAYHALENAGITMKQAFGSKTGVYSGSMADDYAKGTLGDIDDIPKYAVTGAAQNMIANRLSWFYNLHGPSVNLDSACSSSLMALDFACKGLRDRDCDIAMVTGTGLVLAAETTLALNNLNMLSSHGRCFSFDDRADGYSRGEGFCVVLVKRLKDALRDGDTIRAVVRSTGSNQDGHTPGVTQPSRDLQARLIRETYEKAGLSMRKTRFFEAHGTGTPLGDPLEADAIGSTFRSFRSRNEPLYIGALKSNIGHLEGGSGLAAIIKTIMVLEKGIIPPNANFENLNPKIDAEFLNIKFPTECTPWPCSGLRRASVSSFGFGGSNSHAILDDAYHYLKLRSLSGHHNTTILPQVNGTAIVNRVVNGISEFDEGEVSHLGFHMKQNGDWESEFEPKSQESGRLLVFSAADEAGLKRLSESYEVYFQDHQATIRDGVYLDHLAYTLAAHRSSLAWKSFAIVDSVASLKTMGSLVTKPLSMGQSSGLAFVFTGQGAQYKNMGAEMLQYPVFRATIEQFDKQLLRLGCSWSVARLLQEGAQLHDTDDPEFSQPMTTAIQLALCELFCTMNIEPRTVIGHSSGEIAAAYASGALTMRSACIVSYYRGRWSSELRKTTKCPGAMLSVDLSEDSMRGILSESRAQYGNVHIACVNSPNNVTISGNESEIDLIQRDMDSRKILARKLRTGVAYHSPHMETISSAYAESLSGLETRGASQQKWPTMISSVTGQIVLNAGDVCNPKYWVNNMVSPVQFVSAMAKLSQSINMVKTRKLGEPKRSVIQDVIEVGPHPALRRPVLDCLQVNKIPKSSDRYHGSLSRQKSPVQSVLELVGKLYTRGHHVNIEKANLTGNCPAVRPDLLVNLPSYPFNHTKSYWYEAWANKLGRVRRAPKLELLGVPVPDWNHLEPRWRKFFDLSETPWIEDHKVNGKAIYPATGMIVMAIEGARQIADSNRNISGYRIQDCVILAPIPVEDEKPQAQLRLTPDSSRTNKLITSYEFQVLSPSSNGWFQNCRGYIQVHYESGDETVAKVRQRENSYYIDMYIEAVQNCELQVPEQKMYDCFLSNGLEYGPAFQGLSNTYWDGKQTAVGNIQCFKWTDKQSRNERQHHIAHPATLDATGQLGWLPLTNGAQRVLASGFAATRVQDMWLASSGASYPHSEHLRVCAEATRTGLRGAQCSMFALDQAGNVVLRMSHFESTFIGGEELSSVMVRPRQICYEMNYMPDLSLMSKEQLLAYCEPLADTKSDSASFYTNLEMALYYLARKAWMSTHTLSFTDGKRPYMAKYVGWLQGQIQKYDGGELNQRREAWNETLSNPEAIEALVAQVEGANIEGKLLVRVGRELQSIIEGSIDPLEIMFHDGLAERYYEEICMRIPCPKVLTKYLTTLCHKNPHLNVLEVGAGTGSITRYAVEGLGRYSQYTYTDISESFFEGAKAKFSGKGPAMNYRLLDIERDPLDQGYELESYDIIVAAWVLHATSDLKKTIQNVQRLLKPGGKLFLFEITEPEILRNGIAFGTLPGWWLSTEKQRQSSPCLSEPAWSQLLLENGFADINFVLPDHEDIFCRENSVIVATRGDANKIQNGSAAVQVVLLQSSSTGVQNTVAEELQKVLVRRSDIQCQTMLLDGDSPNKIPPKSMLVFLAELDQSYLSALNSKSFDTLKTLLLSAQSVVWLGYSPKTAATFPDREMVKGLARVLSTEKPSLAFITLHFETQFETAASYAQISSQIIQSTVDSHYNGCELEYVEQGGVLNINRVYESDNMNSQVHAKTHTILEKKEIGQSPPLALTVPSPGLLDSLRWEENLSYGQALADDEIEIEVQAIGVNFRDLVVVLGKLNFSCVGIDCAGVITKVGANCKELKLGDRVCACSLGCTRTHVRCHYNLAVKIPDFLSIAEAASVPITGITACYSLITLANLQKEDSILIHCATGGTGQMALQIAQSIGATVFVTVGTEGKRSFAKAYGIPEQNIFYSRDISFSKDLLSATRGRGVDVILNSLSGEALLASWECIAPFGRFIELGKADIQANSKLPMMRFSGEVTFHAVAVDYNIEHRPSMIQKHLRILMSMLCEGTIKVATPLNLYPISKIEDAFRALQSGTSIGKTVLTLSPTDVVPTLASPYHSCKLDPQATYLIAGGLGGLGRSAARWMSQRGGRYIILLSRSGPKSDAAKSLVWELQQSGVTVRTPKCDVSDSESLRAALSQCKDMPPIKGCLQATMVLQDSLFEKMSWDQWSGSIRSKVPSTWNLHTELPRHLSFFVILSSVAGVMGSMGQANYAAGNTYKDGVAAHRVSLGEKAVSIDLGWMGDVGVVAENAILTKGMEAAADLAPIYETEFLALLDYYCNPELTIQPVGKAQAIIGLVTPSQFKDIGLEPPEWLIDRPIFQGLPRDSDHGNDSSSNGPTKDRDWAAELVRAPSSTEATDIVVEALIQKLAKATSIVPEDIDQSRPLHTYGVDSLLAVEIRNWFSKNIKSDVPIFDITGQGSLFQLAESAASQSALLKKDNKT